jgi:hypothetical protein
MCYQQVTSDIGQSNVQAEDTPSGFGKCTFDHRWKLITISNSETVTNDPIKGNYDIKNSIK